MLAVKFLLKQKCRWGKPGDVIEVSNEVANRLVQDNIGIRKSDQDTLDIANRENPDAIAAAKKAMDDAAAEVARLEKEQEEKDAADAKKKADEAEKGGGPDGSTNPNIMNKGARDMAKG